MTRAECTGWRSRSHARREGRKARTNTHAYTPANQRANRFQQTDSGVSESRPSLRSWEIKSNSLAVERRPDYTLIPPLQRWRVVMVPDTQGEVDDHHNVVQFEALKFTL